MIRVSITTVQSISRIDISQIYRVTSRANPDFLEWALTSNPLDPDCVHTPVRDCDVVDGTLTIFRFDTPQEASAFAAGIDLAQIETATAVIGGTVLVDWFKSGNAGVTREDRRTRGPELNAYTVETWWTVIHHTKGKLEAETPEAALAQAREMVRDGTWFFGDPQPVEGSEGAIQITVWSEGMGKELLVDPENDDARLEADQAELDRLRRQLPIATQALREIAHDRHRIDSAVKDSGTPPDADSYNGLFAATGIAGRALTAICDPDVPA